MYLIRNATVYAPEKIGTRDLLVIGGSIVALEKSLTVALPGLETLDARGDIVTPGLIDQHIHLTGGGGGRGPVSRVPEVKFSKLAACGSTSVVGVGGTDTVTRSPAAALAKVRALKQEGISAWMYTSNYALPVSLLSKSLREDLFLVPEVLGVKVAHSDMGGSFPSMEEMLRLASDARVGGMIAGKPGVLHIHVGGLPGAFDVFNALVDAGIPIKHIRPTHCARKEKLFEDALAFLRRGGVIDITSGGNCFTDPHEVVALAVSEKIDLSRVTMTSDGNGSMPVYDDKGNMVKLGTGSVAANLDTLRRVVREKDIPLETVLPLITANPARHLELAGKGVIKAGADADLCFFTQDLDLKHVMAKGRFLVRDSEILVKGTFEE